MPTRWPSLDIRIFKEVGKNLNTTQNPSETLRVDAVVHIRLFFCFVRLAYASYMAELSRKNARYYIFKNPFRNLARLAHDRQP